LKKEKKKAVMERLLQPEGKGEIKGRLKELEKKGKKLQYSTARGKECGHLRGNVVERVLVGRGVCLK